jgi:methionyl-tRNA formyltransferase
MKQTLPAIPFFGSGPVAAKALEQLLEWQPIACVVTKSPPPHHKDPAPVEVLAKSKVIKLHYANSKTELDFVIDSLPRPLSYGIVIDYGVIISEHAINSFPLGIINSHFSLLPQWRGADPLTYTILSGQTTTGVSVMLIDKGLDTGDIIAQAEYDIPPGCTTPQLTDDLIDLSNQTLRQVIPLYYGGDIVPISQDSIILSSGLQPSYSNKISKQDGIIDTSKTALDLEREIRAYVGWPGSRINIKNTWITVLNAVVDVTPITVGNLVWQDKKLLLGCSSGSLNITVLKPEGKKQMSASAFVNGYAHLLDS